MAIKLLGTFEYFDKSGNKKTINHYDRDPDNRDGHMFAVWLSLEGNGYTNVSFTPVE